MYIIIYVPIRDPHTPSVYMIHILLLRLFIAIHDIFQHRYIQYIHY